ncbi:response regulator transcription factor [Vallitalea okinawensis]|uniref:response regulator transcription factor n=1 Tax=Vallitalea okinawensis TaxID=2078660 RepID=UPI0014795969|nr:response regulator [Vallitalea okinawensis]
MYAVLVVEDEVWIRRGIVRKLEKSDFPFTHIYNAKDGLEALKIMKDNPVDIVITDICMPDMTGLELIKRIREENKDTEFMIISGYSEFKYAEEAINMGVKSYLLKPTKEDELKEALLKINEALIEKKKYNRLTKENACMKIRHDQLLIEKEINFLLKSNHQQKSFQLLKDSEPALFQHDNYQLLILNASGSSIMSSGDDIKEDITSKIIEWLHGIKNLGNYYIIKNNDLINQLFIFIYGHQNEVEATCQQLCKECLYNLAKTFNVYITIGKSAVLNHLDGELYLSAKKAIDLRLIHGLNRIYDPESMTKHDDFQFPKTELKLLSKLIQLRDSKNIEILLADIFSRERYMKSGINYLYFVYSEVVNVIYEALYAMNKMMDIHHRRSYDLFSLNMIDHINKIEEIATCFFHVIEERIKSNHDTAMTCKELVDQAVKYIDLHYAERISLKNLALQFGINADYFSSIFKKELGQSFTKYLTKQRLTHACRMLKETNTTVEEIARSVGYSDIQYFYRVFKKEYSYTPIEYRCS